LPLSETTLTQSGAECGGEMHEAVGRLTIEKADHWQRGLLCVHRERPCRRAVPEILPDG
jgi:hypothetical protein